MSVPRVLLAVSLLCSRSALGYEDDYQVTYDDSYYNEIPEHGERGEAAPTAPPCRSQDGLRWDKLFIMLEDSHMRQNMLLHSLDTVVRAELRNLAGDLRRVAGGNAAACDALANRVAAQLGRKAEAAAGRAGREVAEERTSRQEAALQHLLEAGRKQAARLDKMEDACLREGAGLRRTDAAGLEKALAAMATDLHRMQAQLDASQRLANQNFLPSGYDAALFFPVRSRLLHARADWEAAAPLHSLTVCLWAKPARGLNRTALLSYGTPKEVQLRLLLLSGPGQAAAFSVGGAPAVEGRGVGEEEGRWGHYCGAWSSERGLASLWVNGRLAASSSGVAQRLALPARGTFFLGQEWQGGYDGRHPTFDPELAFAGKITGFNVWDRVLDPEEISQHARLDGSGGRGGNVVGWGTSAIVPRGGVEYVT